jgi:hypothetical protein
MKAPRLMFAAASLAVTWSPALCRSQSAPKPAPSAPQLPALTHALAGKWRSWFDRELKGGDASANHDESLITFLALGNKRHHETEVRCVCSVV